MDECYRNAVKKLVSTVQKMFGCFGRDASCFNQNFNKFHYARILSLPGGSVQALHVDHAPIKGESWTEYFKGFRENQLPPLSCLWFPEGGQLLLVECDIATSEA